MLSQAEIQFLEGTRKVSKSYQYKIKSIIRKKLTYLMDKEIPLLSNLFPNLDLTKNSKIPRSIPHQNQNIYKELDILPKKVIKNHNKPSKSTSAKDNEQSYIKSREKINNCNTRAGGLAWLRYGLDVESSNDVYHNNMQTEQIAPTHKEKPNRSNLILWDNYKNYLVLKVKLQH